MVFSRLSIFIIFLMHLISLNGQEPSYRILGEDELSGIDIYSILEDKQRNIWLCTNRGVVKYDAYDFQFLKADHLRSLSSFGLVSDSKGQIFCFNLFGQILKIEDDSVKIFYQLPDSLIFDGYALEVTKEDNLLLVSERNILIENGKKHRIVPSNKPAAFIRSKKNLKFAYMPVREQNKTHEYFASNEFAIHKWNGKELINSPLDVSHIPSHEVSSLCYRYENNNHIFSLRKGGAYVFDSKGAPLYFGNQIFSQYYLSAFLEDYEGNTWYTSLRKGILIVKNHKILSYKAHEFMRNENIVITKYDEKGSLYVGSEAGKVFQIGQNGDVEEVFSNGSTNIYVINFFRNNLISNGATTLELIDLETLTAKTLAETPPIKESKRIKPDQFVFATSKGVSHYKISDQSHFSLIHQYDLGRCNSIFYSDVLDDIYAASVKGLFILNNGNAQELQFENEKIISTSITGFKTTCFIATTTSGILVYDHTKFQYQITTKDGLLSDRILKIKYHQGKLFISNSIGFQVYNIERKKFEDAFLSNTINGSRILDFDLFEGELTVLSNKDLQKFNLESISKNEHKPYLEISKIFVHQTEINASQKHLFSYDENKFEFQFKAKAHRHFGKLTYSYRLIGIDQNWQVSGFNENKIKYAALNPGKYTFEVKAINEDGVASEIVSYQFEIKKAWWSTWWFYTGIVLLLICIIIFAWHFQLKRVQKKNKQETELISSKLTALKLQMNPHFIFNALNSIQDLILKEDTENSYDYIVKFSNLVRMTLKYSDQDLILLEEEVEMLKLYLELENLRFKNDFHFSIDNQIQEEVKIPSMLIQPIIENSVKHGLLHKKGMKNIQITFELKDLIYCTIEDNGIGIEKSKEINLRKNKKHESVSIQSIKKRIQILRDYYKTELDVEFTNLKDQNGDSAGTRVLIKLPFEQQ